MYEGKANLTLFWQSNRLVRLEGVDITTEIPPPYIYKGADGPVAEVKHSGKLTVDVSTVDYWDDVNIIEIEYLATPSIPKQYLVNQRTCKPVIDGTVATYTIRD